MLVVVLQKVATEMLPQVWSFPSVIAANILVPVVGKPDEHPVLEWEVRGNPRHKRGNPATVSSCQTHGSRKDRLRE